MQVVIYALDAGCKEIIPAIDADTTSLIHDQDDTNQQDDLDDDDDDERIGDDKK